jgi:aryl-alcohol dehydrogenase-like predicted oxidoreductase
MNYKIFGKHTGLYVSELILGGAMFGTDKGYGATKEESVSILKAYTDAGGNFIDTSDAYQNGESEKIIGEFIAENRDDYVISSKFTRSASADPSIGMLGNNRKAMIQSVEQSLKRLKTDRIDIYLAHFDDGVTPPDELVRGFEDLVSAGKIIYGGLSNFPAWKMATAVNTANLVGKVPIVTLQTEFSLVQRVPDRELLPMAEYFGLGVMAYSPLAGGLLTGKYRKNETGRINLMKKEVRITEPRNEAILNQLIEIAAATNYSPANVAVAWIGAKGIFSVIGPRTKAHLEDYLTSVKLILTNDQIHLLDSVSEIPLEYPHDINKTQRELSYKKWHITSS